MRAVVQRVRNAQVLVGDRIVGEVDKGLLVYLGVAEKDNTNDVAYLVHKVHRLRIFEDGDGKMNLNVSQIGGGALVVSAFSTQGDARKGHRPSFAQAAPPDKANALYNQFCAELQAKGVPVCTGRFKTEMRVDSSNDGPICVLIDSARQF